MSLVLNALSGERSGEAFPLRDGLTIGRQGADIALRDRRVSGTHAYVRGDEAGGFTLVDNGSKNGLRDAEGQRLDAVDLRVGVEFVVGDVTFRVDLVEQRAAAARPAQLTTVAANRPRPAAPRRFWHEVLAEFLEAHADGFRDRPRALTPLEPTLTLEFARGPQVNAKWTLGYGPRQIGPGSLDLPLWEDGLPDVCFEIFPSNDGVVFKTKHPGLVRLNGRAVDSEVLRMGDVIQINDTLIEVDFSE